jgi:predicted membrane metal-binding protein
MWKFQSGMSGWLQRFVTRHPLFAAAWVVVVCVLAADFHPACGMLTGFVLAGMACLAASWRVSLAWLACGWLAVAVYAWREKSQKDAEREWVGKSSVLIKARVLKDGRGERYWVAPAELLEGGKTGEKVWWQGRGAPPVAGALITARGDFLPLPKARNAGEFDRSAWLRSQGVIAVFQAGKLDTQVETGRWAALGAQIRHGFRDRVTAGLPVDSREAQVIRAVVIGEQPPDADALIAAFRNSGTLHAFSVSGLHVAMVGSIGWFVLGWLGVPRRWAVVVLLPLIFGYSWITGNSAPAVRSAWMAAVFLGALFC